MALPTLTGVARLVADPEIRFTGSGVAACSIRLAFSARVKNEQTGQWEDGSKFFVRGTCWRQLAEHAAESLAKGMEVMVTGDVCTDSWTDKDGQKREATALQIRSIGPSLAWATARVERASRDGSGPGSSSSGQTRQQAPQSAPAADPWATDAQPPF